MFSKKLKKELKFNTKKKFYVNVNKYSNFAKIEDGKEIWTDAFQKAIDENEYIFVPNGRYFIDRSLVLRSNRHIVLSQRAEVGLVKTCKTLLLRNQSVIDGSCENIDMTYPHEQNISISGGLWFEENDTRHGFGVTGKFDEENSLVGVTTCLLFSGVKNLRLSNMRFRNTAGVAIQLGRCENFIIENISFDNCFADGVHVGGHVKNGIIKNIYGKTGDDLVALNMCDWQNSSINMGPLENVLVENVCATATNGYNAFRILPGVLVTKNGEIDCYVKNLCVRKVRGISAFKLYMQTVPYAKTPDYVKVGSIENISLENIKIDLNGPIDELENYVSQDPITGQFGAIEIGSNVNSITLKNINATLNKTTFKNSHLITVGPKASYLKSHNLEVFDPWAVCEVGEIAYKNVKVNGKKVYDLKKEVKTIAFSNLYNLTENNGFGVVKTYKSIK